MELQTYCALNETRECFLGLEVTAGDFSYSSLSREGALTVNPSGGLWLKPFRGIPGSGTTAPVDLMFLDKTCRVVELVESFPATSPSALIPAVESVLVLPEHSILLSETRVGDQVVLGVTEEMQRRLERRYTAADASDGSRRMELSVAKSIGRMVRELVGAGLRSEAKSPGSRPTRENPTPEQENGQSTLGKKRPQTWWRRDMRGANRAPVAGLQAYYWDGLPPQPRDVRDVSSTGLYVVTDDRWYPGTLILMTLQDKDALDEAREQAIAVNVRAVRWGADGVGLQFIPANDGTETQQESYGKGAGRKEIEEFLRRMTK